MSSGKFKYVLHVTCCMIANVPGFDDYIVVI